MTLKDAAPDEIEKTLEVMPESVSNALRDARRSIFQAAAVADGVGPLTETLKWGEPAYLTEAPKTGTTLRLGQIGGRAAIMVPCSTTIIEDARALFGDVPELSGKRGVILGGQDQVVDYVIDAALTYHARKRR